MTDVDRHWRYGIAVLLIAGYVGLAGISFFHQVPPANTRFVDGFFTGLGPIVGAAVTAVLNIGRGNTPQQDANIGTLIDKLPPATTGTGPAQPLDLSGAELPRPR
ncbi:MAG: hypothetical protein EON55_09205 [Alphaproteobacteria bacterium]|nr:MAG: hypothetical protein EON55_09205 [Alphaproteobacteria bacterium]